jgi:Zn-dependent peptidase ImmA (M78 family)
VIVLGATKGDTARSRFDAAHELGHLVLHADGHADSELGEVEAQAHTFAAAFLMPAQDIAESLPRDLNWTAWIAAKHHWRVSLAALLRRGRDLGRLEPEQYAAGMRQMAARGWRRQEPGDLGPPEQPMFLARTVELLRELGLTTSAVAQEADLPAEIIEQFVAAGTDPRPVLTL